MEFFLTILVLLALIGLSNIINHFVPFIPVPLVQIALGAGLAILPFGGDVHLEPELFFILFIAPLLFNDGKNVSRAALWKLRTPILLLALGLVFVTVAVGGYLINWLIPSIPLPAAFALAAILSPTDVVAVGAMASRVKLPKRIMHLLEGEGLMNDASGLVAFQVAVAATVTGVFSIVDATFQFLWVALGGLFVGAFIAFLIIRLRVLVRRLGMEDITIHMLIQILTPFVVFYIAEHFHLSGILAVVAGGIVHAIERDREESPNQQLKVVSKSTWTVILYLLNGLVFVLLGLQIPKVAKAIIQDPNFNNGQVLLYILIITVFLLVLRFIWVMVSWSVGWYYKNNKHLKPEPRSIGIITVSGVRGAVTLAGAFSIPYTLDNGSDFPERSLIIFLAAGVILLTLVAASILLPLIAKTEKAPKKPERNTKEVKARIKVHKAAIQRLKREMTEENRGAALSLISTYNTTINNIIVKTHPLEASENKQYEEEIRLLALQAKGKLVEKLLKEEKIDRETAYICLEHTHKLEMAVTNRVRYKLLVSWMRFKKVLLLLVRIFSPNKQALRKQSLRRRSKVNKVRIQMMEEAIKVIKENMNEENRMISLAIISEYHRSMARLRKESTEYNSGKRKKATRDLCYKAFHTERETVQELYEKGEITREIAHNIRKDIALREALTIEENGY
ncbi:Na+/H+ antiporter [Priestia megaterium]|uniref:Na+/H+ antiporter n=1 Tax=Priestia megaterium TaxID=1404 RepID=UPI000CA3E3DE|nr:Na+/H+ antiporter [Priestia megaterium]AUO09784.1 Na+/H+ antiporter [Priestia megaterium]